MAEALPLGPELLLVPRLEPLCVLHERAQLRNPGLGGCCTLRELVMPAPCLLELSPREAQLGPERALLLAGERVEQIELVRGPGEPALLELARHRDQALGGRRQVLARGAAPPRIGPGSAVGEHPSREHEPFLVLRAELGETRQRLVLEEPGRRLELRLDVGLGGVGPDERRVAAATEQEADRLREDRLAGTRLAGDRAESRSEGEISLADEDEVLDPKAPEHWAGCYAESPGAATGSNSRPAARCPCTHTRAPRLGGWGLGTVPTPHEPVCADCVSIRPDRAPLAA